jgi:hypothetical protein
VADQERSHEERDIDREFRALMEGLRTTLPGVQVLFAFLLTLPLQGAFQDLRLADEIVYEVALVSAAASSVFLIAPSVHQRIRALDRGVKREHRQHLQVAIRFTIAGTIAAAVAICAVMFLASTLVFDDYVAAISTTVIGGLVAWTWFQVPLGWFRREETKTTSRGARS